MIACSPTTRSADCGRHAMPCPGNGGHVRAATDHRPARRRSDRHAGSKVDLNTGWWTIAAEARKNGLAHPVPLSPQALAILKALKAQEDRRLTTQKNATPSLLVLTGARGKRQQAEAAATLGIENFRGHDLRRTAASLMAGSGVPRLVISKILNHVETGVTAIYDRHGYDGEKKLALDGWARTLSAIIEKKDGKKTVRRVRAGLTWQSTVRALAAYAAAHNRVAVFGGRVAHFERICRPLLPPGVYRRPPNRWPGMRAQILDTIAVARHGWPSESRTWPQLKHSSSACWLREPGRVITGQRSNAGTRTWRNSVSGRGRVVTKRDNARAANEALLRRRPCRPHETPYPFAEVSRPHTAVPVSRADP